MNARQLLLFSLLFIASRLFFFNSGPVFFDSPEYLYRLTSDTFISALLQGHVPLHSGYLVIFWPIYHLKENQGMNLVMFGQILLSLAGMLSFYYIVYVLTKNTFVSFFSLITASIVPIVWITHSSIMMESTYVSLFFISWLLLIFGMQKFRILLLIATLLLALSLITQTVGLMWMPLIPLSMLYLFKKRGLLISSLIISIAIVLFSVLNGFAINQDNIFAGIHSLYFDHQRERHIDLLSGIGVIRIIRNWLLPSIANNTSFIFIGGIVGIMLMGKKSRFMPLLLMAWVLPALLTNQWWDSLFFGRHALYASFGLSIGFAYLLQRYKKLLLLFPMFFLTSIISISKLSGPIPYIQTAETIKTLPNNSLIIESHFARPQVEKIPGILFFFVDEMGYSLDGLPELINSTLDQHDRVFISSQALSEPYGLYSGPYLHPITLSYKKPYLLKRILTDYNIKEYKIINREDNLIFYEILGKSKNGKYPIVKDLINSKRRLDYYDPLRLIISLAY